MISISSTPQTHSHKAVQFRLDLFEPAQAPGLLPDRQIVPQVMPTYPVPPSTGPDILFKDAVARFVREEVDTKRTPRGRSFVRSLLRSRILPAFSDWSLRDIKRPDIRELLRVTGSTRPQPYKGAPTHGCEGRANSIFTFMNQFWRWAADEERGDLVEVNPMNGIHTPYRYRERERVLTDDEIRWFWIATGEMGQIGTIARLLLLTAQRRSEVANAFGGQVDWGARTLTLPIPFTKPQRGHIVPLSTLALELLEKVPHGDARDRLFPNRRGGTLASTRFSHANRRLHARMVELQREELTRSGGDPTTAFIPWFCFHDLRRTAATKMCELRHGIDTVDRILNHAAGRTGSGRVHNMCTRTYIRYELMKERAAALQSLGEYVRTLLGDQ